MKKNSKIIIAILTALLLCLALSAANTENGVWDCPECGRTGNTGNFCGKCAHPSPPPEPIETSIQMLSSPTVDIITSEDLVKICVAWNGGTAPYHVYLYPYINEKHNYDGTHVAYIDQKSVSKSEKTEVCFDKYLTPGQLYWIKIVDDAQQESWSKYRFPQIQFEKFKVKIDYVFFEATGKTISKNRFMIAKNNEDKEIATLIRLAGNYSDLFPEGYFQYGLWGFTLIHPNGELAIGDVDNTRYTKDNQKYAEWDLNAAPSNQILLKKLKEDYRGWLKIPAGKYTVILTYGNYYVGSQVITFTNTHGKVTAPKKEPQDTKAPQDTKTPQNTEESQNTESPQDTEASQDTKSSQDTEASQNTESSQDTEAPQNTETSQDTEASQDTESSQNTETSQDTEASQDISDKLLDIRKNILNGGDYDSSLDVNGDGEVSVKDYVLLRKEEIGTEDE